MLFGITGLGSAAVAVALPTLADDLEVSTGRAALVVWARERGFAGAEPDGLRRRRHRSR